MSDLLSEDNIDLDFGSNDFLLQHIQSILKFYDGRCSDSKNGGFFQYFKDNGDVYDKKTRHLVSSARFVFNYAVATHLFNRKDDRQKVINGLEYLERVHKADRAGYAWIVEQSDEGSDSHHLSASRIIDSRNLCYGHAFVVLAGASAALLAGVDKEGLQTMENAWTTMEEFFWDEKFGLYKNESNEDFSVVDQYRGQNANMHACEAALWAFEATGKKDPYLNRAKTLVNSVAKNLANLTMTKAEVIFQGTPFSSKVAGFIWEHYDTEWNIDYDYNKDNPKHLFRPWGFQSGHQIEWAKLLLTLRNQLIKAGETKSKTQWMLAKAKSLFDRAYDISWDKIYGGIVYGIHPNGEICDNDKYFWVQAEALATVKLLESAVKNDNEESEETISCQLKKYREIYQNIWQYCWSHMIDHKYGAWFRIRTYDNRPIDDLKSPAGKTDYHTIGACFEIIKSNTDA